VALATKNTLREDQYDAVGLDPKIRTPGLIKDFIDVAGPFEKFRSRRLPPPRHRPCSFLTQVATKLQSNVDESKRQAARDDGDHSNCESGDNLFSDNPLPTPPFIRKCTGFPMVLLIVHVNQCRKLPQQ
jgi:hypothetical protein